MKSQQQEEIDKKLEQLRVQHEQTFAGIDQEIRDTKKIIADAEKTLEALYAGGRTGRGPEAPSRGAWPSAQAAKGREATFFLI